MESRKTPNFFQKFWKEKKSFNEDNDPLEICMERCSSNQARIQEFERAKSAALLQQAERLCASQKAHTSAVLKRLGLQRDTPLSRQPSAPPRGHPEFSLKQGRIRSDSHGWPLNMDNCSATSRNNQTWDQDTIFDETLHDADELYATDRGPSPDASLNSVDSLSFVDTHTPDELRAISLLRSPILSPITPTPPQTKARRKSYIPVQTSGAGTMADGCTAKSAKTKIEEFMERLGQCHPSPQPPAAPKRTAMAPHPPTKPAPPCRSRLKPLANPEMTTMVSNPPTSAASTHKIQSRQPPAAPIKVAMVPRPPKRPAPTNRRGPKRETQLKKEDLKPLRNPSESLSLCFKQIDSEDWEKKVDGLKTVRALARHHPEILQTKLHELCIIISEEVKNLRSNVACAAIDTIAELHVDLGKTMDPEAERTGSALLLKLAQTTSIFIHQQTNHALDVLVEGCSPGRVISALLNTGLSHPSAAVRGSTAEHLHQLADIMGEDRILTAGRIFTERFIIAVSKMALDAAPEARQHGQKMLEGLAHQKDFIALWDKFVPKKDQRPLAKILKKMRE
ncbi:TOG array regulator of axonemal microtubules protein 2-like [Anabas testudineus]|uniref:TOG array regulator of axonemal microtubules protein 2-like n=1 Tax=Anabas testudineus TaxID=64144 RepID=UPI000E462FF9|nr:TOG array regulator of axonemal microtubules protein 2-like [Anabas testudineus]